MLARGVLYPLACSYAMNTVLYVCVYTYITYVCCFESWGCEDDKEKIPNTSSLYHPPTRSQDKFGNKKIKNKKKKSKENGNKIKSKYIFKR